MFYQNLSVKLVPIQFSKIGKILRSCAEPYWLALNDQYAQSTLSYLFKYLYLYLGFGFLTFDTEDSVDQVVQEHFIQINGKQV